MEEGGWGVAFIKVITTLGGVRLLCGERRQYHANYGTVAGAVDCFRDTLHVVLDASVTRPNLKLRLVQLGPIRVLNIIIVAAVLLEFDSAIFSEHVFRNSV